MPGFKRRSNQPLAELANPSRTDLSVDDLTLPGDKDRAEFKVAQLASSIDDRVAKAEVKARVTDSNTREAYNQSVDELAKSVSEVRSLAVARSGVREMRREQIDLLRPLQAWARPGSLAARAKRTRSSAGSSASARPPH